MSPGSKLVDVADFLKSALWTTGLCFVDSVCRPNELRCALVECHHEAVPTSRKGLQGEVSKLKAACVNTLCQCILGVLPDLQGEHLAVQRILK